MWEDFVIGKGNKGCSAIKVFEITGEHGVSQNSVSYWISDCILGLSGTIFKDTREGKCITNMIKINAQPEKILNYINKVAINNVSIEHLMDCIKQAELNAYEKGRRKSKRELKLWLDDGYDFE